MLSTEQLVELAKKNPENKKLQEDVAIAQRMAADPEFRAQRRAEFQREFLEGAKFAPFRIAGGVVDVANLPGEALGIAPVDPFLGSNYMIDKYATGIEALGGTYRRPTGSGAELAGDILGSTLNVAGATKGLSRLFGRAFKKGQGKELQGTSTAQLDTPTSETAYGAPLEPPTSVLDPLEEARLPSVGAQGGVPLDKGNPVIATTDQSVVFPGAQEPAFVPTAAGFDDYINTQSKYTVNQSISNPFEAKVITYSPTLTSIQNLGLSSKGMPGGQVLNTLSKDAGVMPEIKGTQFEITLKNNPNKKYTETELNILYNDTVPQSYVTTFTRKALLSGNVLPGRYKDAVLDPVLHDELNSYSQSQLIDRAGYANHDQGASIFSVGEKAFFYPSAAAKESGDLNNAIRLEGLEGHRYYDTVPGYYGHIRFQITENYDGGVDFANTANVGEIQSDIVRGYSAFAANQDKNGVLSAVRDANAGITGNRVYLTGEVQDGVDELMELRRPVSDITPSNAEEGAALMDAQAMIATQGDLINAVKSSRFYGKSTFATPEQSAATTKHRFDEAIATDIDAGNMAASPDRTYADALERYIRRRVADRLFHSPVAGQEIQRFAMNKRLDIQSEFEAGGMYEGLRPIMLSPYKGLGNQLQNELTPKLLSDPKVRDEITSIADEVELEVKELAEMYNISEDVVEQQLNQMRTDYTDFNYDTTFLTEPLNDTLEKYIITAQMRRQDKDFPSISELSEIVDLQQAVDNYEMTLSTTSPQTQKVVANYIDAEKKVQQAIQELPSQRAELLRELQTTLAKTVNSNGREGFIFAPPFRNQQQFFEHATRVFPKEIQGTDLGYGSSPIKYVNFPNYVDMAEARGLEPDVFKPTYQSSVNKGLESLVKNVPDAMVGPEGTSGLDLMQTSQGLEAIAQINNVNNSTVTVGNYPSQILNISPGSKIGEALKKPIRRAKGGPVDLRSGIGDMFKLYS